MSETLALFRQMGWQDILDIALVAFVVYKVILWVRGTRAMQMMAGLGLLFVVLVVSQELNLVTTNWIINSFLSSLVLVVIVLFQSDIRRVLANLGRGPFFGSSESATTTLDEVARSAVAMAGRMTGALIVLERRIGLADYVDQGVKIGAEVSRELLISIFQPTAPLHDGAVIIRGDRVMAARCVLPLSSSKVGRMAGTRHRAALGLSEETDAVCVVVSEERGRVSVAVSGKLTQDLDAKALRSLLDELFEIPGGGSRRFLFWKERKVA